MQAAAIPELAVLSALAHARDEATFPVLDALTAALDTVEPEHAFEYIQLVLAQLPAIARAHLEELMATETYEYQSDFTRRIEARGEARGRAAMVLRILHRRGIEVPADARKLIIGCSDLDQLGTWGDRALTAPRVEDLFV